MKNTGNEKMKMNVAVCDDDPIYLHIIGALCHEILDSEYSVQVLEAQSAEELLQEDLVFHAAVLDVQLSQPLEGIHLARKILLTNPDCRIIFVSGYTSVVSEVYEIPHMCLILKEQIQTQLPRFLCRAAEEAAMEAGKTLNIMHHRKMEAISLKQIVFIERRKHETFITLIGGEQFVIREKLTDLLQRISNPYFCRCHVSYAVNINYVEKLQDRCVQMRTGEKIPISRTYEQKFWEGYGRYLMPDI